MLLLLQLWVIRQCPFLEFPATDLHRELQLNAQDAKGRNELRRIAEQNGEVGRSSQPAARKGFHELASYFFAAAENVLEQISYSRRRIGADLLFLLTDNEEQSIRCLFSYILINIKGNALSKRH
jgi:hypothetical protein